MSMDAGWAGGEEADGVEQGGGEQGDHHGIARGRRTCRALRLTSDIMALTSPQDSTRHSAARSRAAWLGSATPGPEIAWGLTSK